MRVLHVVQGYYPAIGGTERLVQAVSERLVRRHGDEVTVYTTVGYNCELFLRPSLRHMAPGSEILNGVSVRRFPVFNRLSTLRWLAANGSYRLRLPYNDRLRALYNGPIVFGMTRAIADAGADIVAASSFPLLHMHYAVAGARRAGVPVVLHGGIHTTDAYGFDRRMIYEAIRQADAYVANTGFERDYLVQRGIPPDKITVIGVGVDPEPFAQAGGRSLRTRFGWADAPVIAFAGQQVPHKGIDLVLAAMRQVWTATPDACLLIAGARSGYTSVLEQEIAGLPPTGRVAVLSDFDEADKPEIFAACDMLAFPSGFESFGIVFLEAWSAGKPVIGVRTGAIPSVVDDGRDGILIAERSAAGLGAAIRTLLDCPELGKAMGAAGRDKVLARYTWDGVTDRYRQLYVDVLRKRAEHGGRRNAG